MQAFTNTPITKEEFIKEIRWHKEQDNFIKGSYWDFHDGKGCAVGCSLESISRIKNIDLDFEKHKLYEDFLGVPEWLARVQDTIFEGLPDSRSKQWPLEFSEAINERADLDKIKPSFLIFVLESNLEILQDGKFKEQRDAVENCIKLWQRKDLYSEEWKAAGLAARSAAWSAAYEKFADKLLELMIECK